MEHFWNEPELLEKSRFNKDVGCIDAYMPGASQVQIFTADGTLLNTVARVWLQTKRAIAIKMDEERPHRAKTVIVKEGDAFRMTIQYEIVDLSGHRITGLNHVDPSLPEELTL